MLCTFRVQYRGCLKKYLFYISTHEFSAKVSHTASDPLHPDTHSNTIGDINSRANLVSSKTVKGPLCTSFSDNGIQNWEIINTDWKSIPFAYLKLSKIRLTTLVVVTTVAGYAAATAPFHIGSFLCCCLGTGLVSSAANAVNQYHEVPFDAQMSRTKNRVLVKSQLSPLHAIGFAFAASSVGLAVLYSGCNSLTASLGAVNLILYTCIYTPLKRISILNTWVGSVVGALPPMMGWASCTGSLDSGAWLLAAILYAWQFPHFNALSWNLRPDYSKAGYRMMAVTNPGLCRRTALRYTSVITVLCFLAPFCDVTNNYFPLVTLPLNSYFTYLAFRFYCESDSASSRKLFRFSLIHLPLLITLLLLNKKRWFIPDNAISSDESLAVNAETKPLQSNLQSTISSLSKLL